MSKIFTLAKPRAGDWQGLIVAIADIERDLNRAIPYRFGVIADGQYLIRNGGSIVGASAPGGAGAPVGAGYITIAADATLTSERILGVGSPLVLTDFGAGAAAQITFQTQAANLHFMGPTSGPAAAPTFRTLVPADIPDSALGSGATGAGVFLRGDRTWAAVTVSSIPWASITGTPTTIGGYGITDFNSLGDARWSLLGHTHTFASLTAKPTTIGGYGITDFNSLGDARWSLLGHTHVAGDITNFNAAGDARWSLLGHVHSAADITSGILAIARGGTNLGTYTQGDLLYASATNVLSKLALGGTDGFVLTSNTASGLPEWRTLPAPTVYAPTGASYITIGLDGGLSAERTLGAASPLVLTDTGPNGSASIGFSSQSANLVLAGPSAAGPSLPTFRSLTAGDIPTLPESQITNLVADLAAKATGGQLIGSYDPGTTPLVTEQFMFQYKRLRLTGAERLTVPGTSTMLLTDLGNKTTSPNVGTPKVPASFCVPTDYFLDQLQRLRMEGQNRATLQGTADLIITDDFGTRSRIALAGRGNG